MLVGSFADGSLRRFNPDTGDAVVYSPTSTTATQGYGGVFFSKTNPYMMYAVTDDPFNAAGATT